MTSNHLTAYVDVWTVQAVTVSRWLTRLYRSLRDDRQAAIASQAGTPAEERLKRLGLQNQVTPLEDRFIQKYPDETKAEESAWIALIEAHAGLSAFFAVTDSADGKPVQGLLGARTATYGALRKAIRGFHVAFPESMAKQGAASAFRKATDTCVGAFLSDVDEVDPEKLGQLRAGLQSCVLEALGRAVTTEL